MPSLVSARGVLAFLSEEEPELRVFALQTLNEDIDTVWFEVAESLSQMYGPALPPPLPLRLALRLSTALT